MDSPEVRYVKTPDGAHLAYQVFGDGPFDMVVVPGPWHVDAAAAPDAGEGG